jgi:tetraacyldisaccharide 4'-kinase
MTLALTRHRLAHWLWERRGAATLARLVLLPLALLYRGVMVARAAAYRRGWLAVRALPAPSVAVGNLSVGGSGKTPLAAWIARRYQRRGRTPAILLRGYGGDEPLVHRRLAPGAVVVADPDRVAGARRAVAQGADVLVLDDAYQLLHVARDLNVAVVSAESARAARWPLPAGPWREGWGALERAECVVVTRKRATARAAEALAAQLARRCPGVPVAVAHLELDHLEGMRSGLRRPLAVLEDRRVVAAAGIADPLSFAVQVRSLGARVELLSFPDHHPYARQDVARLVRAAAEADYVVITEKDAVKLRERWPGDAPEPLVATLAVRWEANGRLVEDALDSVLR